MDEYEDGWTTVLFDNEDQFQAFRTVGREVIGFNTHSSGFTDSGQRYLSYAPEGERREPDPEPDWKALWDRKVAADERRFWDSYFADHDEGVL